MEINLDEIGDGAVENAIGEVASRATEKKSQACGVHGADAAAGNEQPGDDCNDDDGAGDENCAQGRRGKTGEKTEGDAGVAGVNEIHKIIDDCCGETTGGAGLDPGFGGAIKKDDGKG